MSKYQSNETLEQLLSRGQENKLCLEKQTVRGSPVYRRIGHCGPEVPSGPAEVAKKSVWLNGITIDLTNPG